MAVDIRGIEKALVKTVRTYIGSKLSTIGTGVNQKASVIRSRLFSSGTAETTPTFPDYPYASVDYTRLTDEGYELTERVFDAAGNYVYRTHKLASYKVTFYGTSKDDVMSLCNEMHMMLEVDEIRSMINTLSPTEASVRGKTDPVFVASVMEDKYREVATFDIILAVLDETVIPADPLNPPINEYNSIIGNDAEAVPIENVILDTTIPQEGVQGGIYINDPDNPELQVYVDTDITYP